MADAWPLTLPQYLERTGYSQAIADGRLRSQPDTGPAKVRLRSSAMPAPLQGQMVMTGTQLATMRTFVASTLIGGSLPFTFPDPLTRDPILVRFREQLPSWTARGGDNFTVSLDLEALP